MNIVWIVVGDQGLTALVQSWETKAALLKNRC